VASNCYCSSVLARCITDVFSVRAGALFSTKGWNRNFTLRETKSRTPNSIVSYNLLLTSQDQRAINFPIAVSCSELYFARCCAMKRTGTFALESKVMCFILSDSKK